MRNWPLSVVFLTLVSSALAADGPSLEEARDFYSRSAYRDTISVCSRLLEVRGPKAQAIDRYAVAMLKAEAQLRTQEVSAAANTFVLAGKEAATPEQREKALALETLVRRAPNGTYQSKTDESKSFDITDDKARPGAFAALFDDEIGPARKQCDRAKAATHLAAIQDFVKSMPRLQAIEVAATGKTTQAGEMIESLRDRAGVLLDAGLDSAEKQVETIRAEADKLVLGPVDYIDKNTKAPMRKIVQRKKGPTAAQLNTLKNLDASCEKLPALLTELSTPLNIPPEANKPRLKRNEALQRIIKKILTTDYNKQVANEADPAGGQQRKKNNGG